MNREALADFLRTRRLRLQPADVGLPAGHRRRTPGLRREEVAHLAAISVDYYTRLEQARGPRPSRQVLAALARALQLGESEWSYLASLIESPSPPTASPRRDVPMGVLRLIDRLDDPAYVTDAKWDVLAWNAMAAAAITDFSALPEAERNAMRWLFTDDASHLPPEEAEQLAREAVADLRGAFARYPHDEGVRRLVHELQASNEFRRLWNAHDVNVTRTTRKTIFHREVGEIEVDIQTLLVPERDQRLVIYTTTPGTASHRALQLLKVVGTQDLGPVETTDRRESNDGPTALMSGDLGPSAPTNG